MWLMLNNAFLSIVRKDCARDELLVRARRRGDIAKVFPGAKVKRSTTTDYRFRAVVKVAAVTAALAREVSRMTLGSKLQRYALVGMKHRGAEAFVAALRPDAPLMLVREADNKFDRNAVQVWAKDGDGWRHVGYVPKTQNQVLAQFIDNFGKSWCEPQPVMALDAPVPNSIKVSKAVDGRLHLGSNTYPLVEVG